MADRKVCVAFGSLYPYSPGGIEVLFTNIFNRIIDEKKWDIVALARIPRKQKQSVFSNQLPTIGLPSLRSAPFGKLFDFIYFSFLDLIYFDKRVSSLASSYLKEFDVVVTPDPLLTVELCKRKQRPRVIQFVSGSWADTISKVQPLLRSYTTKIEARAYWEADKVIFMDETYASRFSVRKGHGVIILNGINLNLYNPYNYDRAKLRRHFDMDGKTVIVTVATLRRGIKGHEFLLQSIPSIVEDFPNCHFYLIGTGNQDWLRKLSHSLAITDNLHILGERNDIPQILCASDVFVLPSLSEGTPTALLEAMAMELPCIATRVGNIPGVMRNRQEGILIEPAKPSEISDAIAYILANPNEAKILGASARKRVQECHNLSTTSEAYAALIDEVCS